MLRDHCLQQCYSLSEPAMDETRILTFRHLLEKHEARAGRANLLLRFEKASPTQKTSLKPSKTASTQGA